MALVALPLSLALPATADDNREALAKAAEAVAGDRLEEALGVLRAIEPTTPAEAAEVDLLVGRIYLQVGKPGQALAFFEHAATSTLDDGPAYVGMAEASLALGEIARARRFAESALRGDGDLVGAHLVLAQADDRSGRVEAAGGRFESLSRERPESEDVALAHAEFLFNRGDETAALDRLERFAKRHPPAAAAHDALGRYLWVLDRADPALRHRTIAAREYRALGNHARADAIITWIAARDPDGSYRKALDEPGDLYRPRAAERRHPPTGGSGGEPPVEALIRPEPIPIPPGKAGYSQGSGFIVDGGRHVVTNRHVIEGTSHVAVRNGLGQVRRARVVRIASDDDLAVLELERPFPDEMAIPTTAMVDAVPGRAAVALGYPMAGDLGEQMPSLTEGVVQKTTGFRNDPRTFLMTTKINKGNSGGPVFDDRGHLIGVVVAKLDTLKIYEQRGFVPEDVNLGIKISRVTRLMGWPTAAGGGDPGPMPLEELYRQMLAKVVLIVGVVEEAKP